MEFILIILTAISFLIFWVTTVRFCTPACFNLKTMMNSIEKDGVLTRVKAPRSWRFFNFQTLDCWEIKLPTTENHLKYKQLEIAVKRIKTCREIMVYTAPVMLVCGFILLVIVEK
jgi:hypothetical protein